MMSLPVWRPDFQVEASRRWRLIFALLVMITVLWISVWQLSVGAQALVMLLVLAYSRRLWRRTVVLTDARAIRRIRLEDEGWYLHTSTTVMGPYQMAPATWVQAGFIWLVWRGFPGDRVRGQGVLLWPDSVPDDDYRRLQGFLRWQGAATLTPHLPQRGDDMDV